MMTDDWSVSDNLSLTRVNNGIEFDQFDKVDIRSFGYFLAPVAFTGNKLTAYGGYFSFEISYEGKAELEPLPLFVHISVNSRRFFTTNNNIINSTF